MFAIAVDQPFRFPAAFTFVLRAFSTLEGLGKALDPEYKFADVARPYALELLELQVAFPLGLWPLCGRSLPYTRSVLSTRLHTKWLLQGSISSGMNRVI